MGNSPIAYLIQLRINRAADMLRQGDRSITDIAFDVGFSDSNYFMREFRKVIGISPRIYRRQHAYAGAFPKLIDVQLRPRLGERPTFSSRPGRSIKLDDEVLAVVLEEPHLLPVPIVLVGDARQHRGRHRSRRDHPGRLGFERSRCGGRGSGRQWRPLDHRSSVRDLRRSTLTPQPAGRLRPGHSDGPGASSGPRETRIL